MKIDLTTNAAEIVKDLEEFPPKMARGVARAMNEQNELTVGHIVRDKLTAAGPRYLNVRSGRMRKSARRTKAEIAGLRIVSSIGSNLVYAGVHEYGFQGTVQVQAFTRRAPQGDRFSLGGKSVTRPMAESMGLFDKRGRLRRRKGLAQESSGISRVKAHSRRMNFPARHMFEDGVTENLDAYADKVSEAITEAWG
jgi:hypothetical protein